MKYKFMLFALIFGLSLGAQTPRQSHRAAGQIPVGNEGSDLLVDFHGTISELSSKKLVLALEESKKGEENTMDIYLTRKTVALDGDKKMKLTDLKTGQPVEVETKRQIDGSLEAVRIHAGHQAHR